MMPLYLLLAIIALQLVDAGMQYYILRTGLGRQENRLLAWLSDKLGLGAGLLLPKAAVTAVLLVAMDAQVIGAWEEAAILVLYASAVVNNYTAIRSAPSESVSLLRLLGLLLLLVLCQVAAILAPLRVLWALLTNNHERAREVIKAYDLLGNAVANGRFNELISTRANRARREGRRWGCILCRLLDSIDKDHCANSPP